MNVATEVELIGLVLSLGLAELAGRRWTPALVVFWAAIAALLAYLVGGWWLVVPLAIAVGWLGWVRWTHRSAQSTVQRWNRRNTRHEGMASRWALLWHSSGWAMKRKASVLRPTFTHLRRWERWLLSAKCYALPMCRVGWFRMWVSIEEVVCIFGRPRRGKTGQLTHYILDAPGAVLTTSTKVDIVHLTRGYRERHHGPTYVFNPTALGELPNTIFFDPLIECDDPERAEERAIDFISGGVGSSDGEGKRWDDQAQRVLTGLLHAAALGGHSIVDVLRWVSNPDESERQVMALMRRSPSAYAFVPSAEQFFGTNDRTRTSVTFTIMPALAWVANWRALAVTQGATQFDVRQLLADHATVYLLGSKKGRLGPLLSALTGYISREAKRYAAECPGGRLDPTLTLVLDEVANICPVPLPEWTSDFGSHGITIIAAFQSKAQMIGQWGQAGARAISNNTGATVLHAYGFDDQDLQAFVNLSGHRDEVSDKGVRRVPVLSMSQLTNLPRGTVVVWGPEHPVTVGRMRPVWKRRDLRAQLRAEGNAPQEIVAAFEELLSDDEPAVVPAGDR